MHTRSPMAIVQRSAVGSIALLGIVLARAVGSHDRADAAAAPGGSHGALDGTSGARTLDMTPR